MALSKQDSILDLQEGENVTAPDSHCEDEMISGSSDEDGDDLTEKRAPLIEALVVTTKKAFRDSPPKEPAQDFQRYWRNVLTRMWASITNDPGIPKHLTAPPTQKFTIKLIEEPHGLCCPCGLPDVDPNIELENEDGVTKDDLMKGFIDCMYGELPTKIYDESGRTTEQGTCSLMYHSDWMSAADDGDGGRITYVSNFTKKYQVPNIVLYCCEPENFLGESSKRGAAWDSEEKVESKLQLAGHVMQTWVQN